MSQRRVDVSILIWAGLLLLLTSQFAPGARAKEDPEPISQEPLGILFGPTLVHTGQATSVTEAVMRATEAGVAWIVANQRPDGGWEEEAGRVGTAGLALTALMDAGHTVQGPGEVSGALRRGLTFLIGQMQEDGCIGERWHWGHIVVHASALYALARAYLQTGEPSLGHAVDSALNYALTRRIPGGGWGGTTYLGRSNRRGASDAATTGAICLSLEAAGALRSVEEALGHTPSMDVPSDAVLDILSLPQRAADREWGTVFYVQETSTRGYDRAFIDYRSSLTRTAVALYLRAALDGQRISNGPLAKLSETLTLSSAGRGERESVDYYYWCFGARACAALSSRAKLPAHLGKWRDRLVATLIQSQHSPTADKVGGSWDPGPWVVGTPGGSTTSSTALAISTLRLATLPFLRPGSKPAAAELLTRARDTDAHLSDRAHALKLLPAYAARQASRPIFQALAAEEVELRRAAGQAVIPLARGGHLNRGAILGRVRKESDLETRRSLLLALLAAEHSTGSMKSIQDILQTETDSVCRYFAQLALRSGQPDEGARYAQEISRFTRTDQAVAFEVLASRSDLPAAASDPRMLVWNLADGLALPTEWRPLEGEPVVLLDPETLSSEALSTHVRRALQVCDEPDASLREVLKRHAEAMDALCGRRSFKELKTAELASTVGLHVHLAEWLRVRIDLDRVAEIAPELHEVYEEERAQILSVFREIQRLHKDLLFDGDVEDARLVGLLALSVRRTLWSLEYARSHDPSVDSHETLVSAHEKVLAELGDWPDARDWVEIALLEVNARDSRSWHGAEIATRCRQVMRKDGATVVKRRLMTRAAALFTEVCPFLPDEPSYEPVEGVPLPSKSIDVAESGPGRRIGVLDAFVSRVPLTTRESGGRRRASTGALYLIVRARFDLATIMQPWKPYEQRPVVFCARVDGSRLRPFSDEINLAYLSEFGAAEIPAEATMATPVIIVRAFELPEEGLEEVVVKLGLVTDPKSSVFEEKNVVGTIRVRVSAKPYRQNYFASSSRELDDFEARLIAFGSTQGDIRCLLARARMEAAAGHLPLALATLDRANGFAKRAEAEGLLKDIETARRDLPK